MRADVLACPPIATESTSTVVRPSEAAYTAAPSPAGPAPTTTVSHASSLDTVRRLRAPATSRFVGLRSASGPLRSSGVSPGSTASGAEQPVGVGVGFEVEKRVRNPVAGEELPQAAAVGVEPRAHQPHARPEPDQVRAPGQERAKDYVPEGLVRADQVLQLVDGEHDRLAGLAHHGSQIGGLAGHEVQLAREAVHFHESEHPFRRRAEGVDHGDPAVQDHVQLVVDLARAVQGGPGSSGRRLPAASRRSMNSGLRRGNA